MAKRSEDIKARLLATFRPEAREHLETIARQLLALEQDLAGERARGAVENVFRAFHTLKGAARSVSLMEIEALAQACESVLSRVTRDQAALTGPILKALHEMVGAVGRLVEGGEGAVDVKTLVARLESSLGATRPAPPPLHAAAAELPRAAVETAVERTETVTADTLRVATAKLDALLVHAEDLLGPRLAAGERARESRDLVATLAACRRALLRLRAQGQDGHHRDATAALETELREAEAQARALLAHARRDDRALAGAVNALQQEARGLRLSPASTILEAFPRMVRDLAESQGKQAEWAVEGAALEIDRKVLEAIKDPLIHLVRNAVDHGLEAPEERARAGKPRRGRVFVSLASLEGGRVEIRVEDDGAGIDKERLKASAVRLRQLTAEQAGALGAEEALDLVFRSGVSTAPVLTSISGHGRGLPIVRERVERLGGQVRLETRSGEGTTVVVVVPASIATFSGLLVRAGDRPFLLAAEAVERVLRVRSGEIRSIEGQETLFRNGDPLPLASLSALLDLAAAQPAPNGFRSCVVIASGGERMAVLVDEVLGEREVVVKELKRPLVRVRHVAGAGLLGSGELALILRPADLLRFRAEIARPAPMSRERKPERTSLVLVVDDSITTRTMEKNLLEAAGYHVQVAVDGVEAWTALKSQEFDLVVSDVDMPRMDGFELTSRIRADRALADLPVVLVTALETREDKERGIEVGANAYVVKSSFDQSNLLEILRRLA